MSHGEATLKRTQVHLPFAPNWTAEVLAAPPLIAPARQFVYPQRVAGEEDALARGAMLLAVNPASGGSFLAICALGFRDAAAASGVWSTANADVLLAVAGGYAYLVDTRVPENCEFLLQRPVLQVLPALDERLLLLVGAHTIDALGEHGLAWRSARLSWEGVTVGELRDGKLHGTGWNMQTDHDVPFTLNLKTGEHDGGGFTK